MPEQQSPPAPPEDTGLVGGRRETANERLDRNWIELLQELRVAQTGVQILMGFLLIVPFQSRFADLDDLTRVAYILAVSFAGLTVALLIAPVSAHRMLFRRREKDVLVDAGDRVAKLGLGTLAVTIVLVIFLVFSVVLGQTAAWVAAAVAAATFAGTWVLFPFFAARAARRRRATGA